MSDSWYDHWAEKGRRGVTWVVSDGQVGLYRMLLASGGWW